MDDTRTPVPNGKGGKVIGIVLVLVVIGAIGNAFGPGNSDTVQVVDRDRIVVAQRPAPGVPIGEGDAVLSVVKRDEPHDC